MLTLRSIHSAARFAAIAILAIAAVVPVEARQSADLADSSAHASISMKPTALGCDITIRAHNNANAGVTIDLEDSEVKVRNGFWKKLNQGGNWVVNTGGNHESKVVSLDLGCNFDRQYKFLMRSGGDSKYIYFPGSNDFTQSVSLGLANVGRHF
jgi:hypothetical protein